MGLRFQLQALLESIAENVYFQPPPNIDLSYPCIIYARDGSHVNHADDILYQHVKRYMVTVIDRNPDSNLPDMVENLRWCKYDRFYALENLNHHVFSLFF